MHLRTAISVSLALAMAIVVSAMAETPATTPTQSTADLYLSPGITRGALPSGAINPTPNILSGGEAKPVPNGFNAKPVAVNEADVVNLQGCTGVGQGEFTSGIYNMGESFGKFQKDVDSLLSKQLLTMNFIMPQTAALFDQLNNYGNQKYESFQKGCSVDALKQDAHKQYMAACMTKARLDKRVTDLKTALKSSNPQPTEDAYQAMAYSQMWETCSNLYISDTTIVTDRKKSNLDFAKQTRAAENVNETIKSWLCTPPAGTTANASGTASKTEGNGCFPSLLIPQVRLCLDGTLPGGCKDAAGYGVKDAIMPMPRLFDIYRFILDDEVVGRRIQPLQEQIRNIGVPIEIQKKAAADAVLLMSTGTVARLKSGNTLSASRVNQPLPAVEDFQLNYLSCRNPSVMEPIQKYMEKLQAKLTEAEAKSPKGAATTLKLPVMDSAVYTSIVKDKVQLDKYDPAPTADDIAAFAQMLEVSLGCAANQTIPMFDPNLTVSFNANKCALEDKQAFYTMAGYDLAMAATRDTYRFVNSRLKQVYTRLMTEQIVPTPSTSTANATPTVSPEINARLAAAVKESMIPYIEAQIERLDEMSRSRGQFAQRVERIYTMRSGCVTGNLDEVLPGGAPLGHGGRLPGRI